MRKSFEYRSQPFPSVGMPASGRLVSHEAAADAIEQAGKRHASSAESALVFLKRIGVLDSNGDIAERYR